MWLPLTHPPLETLPATQACALTRNWSSNTLTLQPGSQSTEPHQPGLKIYLFLERGEGKERGRERNINVWLLLANPLLGIWPATQACALTSNQTSNPLVHCPCSIHWATPAKVDYIFHYILANYATILTFYILRIKSFLLQLENVPAYLMSNSTALISKIAYSNLSFIPKHSVWK